MPVTTQIQVRVWSTYVLTGTGSKHVFGVNVGYINIYILMTLTNRANETYILKIEQCVL